MYRHEQPEGTVCAFWGDKIADGITIARYYRTERRTPFDIHWTTKNDYFQNCSPDIEAAIEKFRAENKHRATITNEPPHFIA